ncbi:prephenate dehydrogenase/arogenate dehydrogenase family protein [Persephonella atlantica]|uniref:Prephenate dehydrogenase/arogenate dehydrogenase family protein n=1 Tax=Persephonella atlantica TaxID=2699429 RepID=A0ABS1GHI0_9AQUI|nr:prephenate dehydrogenase/arogenate dehydrogenase family protein [Persephonella atlantica]MBK3332310.1 prephenate dehydrogenase/arogenate dehydrogenase family protein [Persephonella atlantica]
MEKDFGGFRNILIIGLGLIGGSIAVSLKNSGYKGKIYGFDLSEDRVKKAIEMKAVDEAFTDLKKIPWKEIDLVIIATPVKTFENVAKQIKPYLRKDTVVTDVGSVKGELVKKLQDILKPVKFVGAHPIAGTEKEGIENSVVGLFRNKKLILTIDEEDNSTKKIEKFWTDLGAKVEVMDPYTHDFVFASVSHLPHAVAFALVDALIELSKETGIDLFLYPGAGFKDFTRIAASSPTVWKDIFIENKENLLHTIDKFIQSMEKLKRYIEEENQDKLIEILSEIREKRLSLEKEEKDV